MSHEPLPAAAWTASGLVFDPSNPVSDPGITQQNISVLKIADGEYWMYVEVENRRIGFGP